MIGQPSDASTGKIGSVASSEEWAFQCNDPYEMDVLRVADQLCLMIGLDEV